MTRRRRPYHGPARILTWRGRPRHEPDDPPLQFPYRVVRACLNLKKPADRRLSDAMDAVRGDMSVATFLREAIAQYVYDGAPQVRARKPAAIGTRRGRPKRITKAPNPPRRGHRLVE